MNIGIVITDQNDWTARALVRSVRKRGAEPVLFRLSEIPSYSFDFSTISDVDAVIVRDLGAGAFEEVSFKFDLLRILEKKVHVINTPESIRNSANKYYSLHLLKKAGLPVPETVVTTDVDVAMDTLDRWGEAVSKPIFGYKGIGIRRFQSGSDLYDSNSDSIEEILSERGVLYLQKFIPIERDIRAFVVGDRVAGAIYRYAQNGWITNLSQGGTPEQCLLNSEQEEVSILASEVIGTDFAGVDIVENDDGFLILEVNGTPSGKGIYEACGVDVTEDIVDHLISITG
ncbi:MAG: Tetrahydromethanopterin:alpha-L-glutamate ligase [Candidatus Methanogaster sp.]|nr:MAG: Tetrahydromethanopterin:alpha-L-glutamate ligase [ANME-2 cluster archaeon]